MIYIHCIIVSVCIMILLYYLFANIEKYQDYALNHSTKCFSCERDIIARYGPEWAWLGQDTKSFDSELDMIRQTGDISSAFNTHDIRYY